MRYYTHIVASLIFASLFAILLDVPITSLYIFVAIIVAPSLDLIEYLLHEDDLSTFNKKTVEKKSRWKKLCSLIQDKLHIPRIKSISRTSHNRRTHNLFILFASLILLYFSIPIGLAAFSAIFSHLFLDLFTVHGCPLLYPFREIKFVALKPRNRVRTGTRQEKALFIFLLMVVLSGLFCYFNLFEIVDGHLYTTKTIDTGNSSDNNTTKIINHDKSNINLNVYADKKGEKNITIDYQDQKTNILVTDIKE